MNVLVRLGAVLTALALLAGCATKPAIPLDRTSAKEIKTIGILTPDMPTGPSAILASTPGQSFGLVGALIDAGIESSRESDLKAVLAGKSFTPYDRLMGGIKAALEAQGYEVKQIAVARTVRGEFLKTYPAANTEKVDAYLDVVLFRYGYGAAGISASTPYRPSIETRVRLVDAKDTRVLMEDIVFYNRIFTALETNNVTIAPDPEYSFAAFSDLTNNPDKAVEGLDLAFVKSTEAVGVLLR